MATEAQITANGQNAQLSTGPVSADGKHRSSHNAVKTGLTGQTVLLPTDDVDAYRAHVARFNEQFNPANDEERALVQSIADTDWRLIRIPSLEAGIRAIGRKKLADLYPEETDPATRTAFIEAEVQMVYRKDLSNLALQETRLRRHRAVDTEKLESLQTARQEAQRARRDMKHASILCRKAAHAGYNFVPSLFGFEFSLEQIKAYIDREDFKNQMVGHGDTLSNEEYGKAFDRFVTAKTKAKAA